MIAVRTSLLFAVTTDPTDTAAANPHSGGWSESFWGPQIANQLPYTQTLALHRARLLPGEAQIIGYRIETFDLSGNKLTPSGATSGRFRYPGVPGRDLNLPQDALMMSGQAAGAINNSRFNLRCLPDGMTTGGEYQPTPAYKATLTLYSQVCTNGHWGFIGRVKSGSSARVNSIAGGVVTLNAPVGGVANVSFLRLNRVYDVNGNPVKGSFLITAINGNAYTVAGLGATSVTIPSGSARIDVLALFAFGTVVPSRAVVRKIGRPFEQYRGRASARA